MILDLNTATGAYFLRVPRQDKDRINSLIMEHGFDFSTKGSSAAEAILITHEPYAAVTFFDYATMEARGTLENMQAEIESSRAPIGQGHVKIPADKTLWPFQKASIEYALRRPNTLVGDQPGLGKTPIAIAFANEISARRILVICPANIRLQWVRQIRAWTTLPWPYTVHTILNGRRGVHPNAEWTVVSYDLARTEAIGKALARQSYDLLILDEAHYVKTIDSRRTRAIFGGGDLSLFQPIAGRSRRILGLTGTPLPNRPREAYTLARGLCFDAIDWASEDNFRERFNPSVKREFDNGWGERKIFIDERTGRHAELQNRLRANFMVRHLKRDVMPQLKLPVYDIVQMEETGPVKQALAAESLLHIDPETFEGADAAILGHVAAVRRQMGVALAPQIADYIEMLLDGGEEKLVVFAWHIEVLDILEGRLNKYGLVRIDGSTSPTKRQRLVDQFRADPKVQIVIGNLQSMGIGTDGLQDVSCHALIAEPSWTPGDNQQAVDRLDRGGQHRTVQADILVAPNSIAERILAAALRKNTVTNKVLDARNNLG